MLGPEPDGKKPSLFRRVAGGSASRAELYGIVGATFVLIVGGVSGAAVSVSHQGSTPAATTTTSQATSSLPRPPVSAGSTTSTSLPAGTAGGSPAFPNSGPADNGNSSQFISPNTPSPVLTTTTTSPPTLLSASWEVSTCIWPAWTDPPHPGGIIDFHYSNGTTRNVYVDASQYPMQQSTYSGGIWWGNYFTVTHDDLGNVIPGNGLQIWCTQAHITSGDCGPAVFGV